MGFKKFTLESKVNLTNDVFELVYTTCDDINHEPGQFITYILDKIGGRSYSILGVDKNKLTLLIKRVSDGKGGSKAICDMEIGSELNGVGPVGKFVLQKNTKNKLFAGTGTGLVPLYNQIKYALENDLYSYTKLMLLFGVRTSRDLFYVDQLISLKEKYPNFDYKIALSREDSEEYHKGYITDFVDENLVNTYKESYLCGAPVVVDSMKESLMSNGVEEKNIYSEKY